MGWRLYLDDHADGARRPRISVEEPGWRRRQGLHPSPPQLDHLGEWVLARSHAEAVAAMEERGLPAFVSFDHDLGDGVDGMAVARWIVERDMDDGSMPADFAYEVHSANPVGKANIVGLLEPYLRHRAGAEGEAFTSRG